jgi:autotransporter passenger strand-loop-strand repeat protein
MTNVVVAPHVTSSGLSLGFNDTLTVSSGGEIKNSFLQDTSTTTIQNGGSAYEDIVTDRAVETVHGTDELSDVGNGAEIYVAADGYADGTFVFAGGTLIVAGAPTNSPFSGIANATYVLSGLMEVISNGESVGTRLNDDAQLVVYSGTALDTLIVSGGLETVESAGSVDTGSEVASGGVLLAVSGGLISVTSVTVGGEVLVQSGATLESATVNGGIDIVSGNALAISTTVSGGGEEVISGGSALLTTLSGSGSLQIVDGGVGATGGAAGTVVGSGGEQLVVSSGLGQATTVSSGGSAAVETGGDLNQTTVSSGGVVIERYFGSSTNTDLMAGATDLVESGGIAILAHVVGSQQVSGGETSATTVVGGGQETVFSGGLASGTVVSSGGTLTVSSGGAADGADILGGGTLVVDGTLSSDATITVAGDLTLGGSTSGARAVTGAGTLAFTGGTSTLGAGAVLTIADVTQNAAAVTAATSLSYAGVWTQGGGWLYADAGDTLTFTGTGNRFLGTLGGNGAVDFVGGSDILNGARLLDASTVIDGAAVTLAGDIDLTKTLAVTSPDLVIANQGAVLSGGGTLTLTDLASNKIVGATATAALTNVNNTIQGAGDLGGGSMVLANQIGGTIASTDSTALVIDTGANTILNSGTIASEGAGGLTIRSAVVNDGVLGVTAGTLTLNAAVTGTGEVLIDAGTAYFAAAFSQNVEFQDTTGVLELANSQAYTGQISNFSLTGGTSLDLRDISFTSGKTKATFVQNGAKTQGVLTVTDGTHTALITLVGNYSGSTFTASSDGHGGTSVVDPHKSPTAATPPRPATVLPFIAAMAGFDTGAGHWVPTGESGRSPAPLLAATHPS